MNITHTHTMYRIPSPLKMMKQRISHTPVLSKRCLSVYTTVFMLPFKEAIKKKASLSKPVDSVGKPLK